MKRARRRLRIHSETMRAVCIPPLFYSHEKGLRRILGTLGTGAPGTDGMFSNDDTHQEKQRKDGRSYRFAPKASRRPSQSFTTNSRLCQGMLPSPGVNSTPWAAYSAKSASASSTNRYASSNSSRYLSRLAVGGWAQRK